jgi:HSP20 family protein
VTQEAKKRGRVNKFLIGAVTVLAVALIGQTGYLIGTHGQIQNKKPWPGEEKTLNKALDHGWQVPQSRQKRSSALFDDPWHASSQWDPFLEIERMQNQMNRVFRESFRRAGTLFDSDRTPFQQLFEPDLDVQDKGDHYLVVMDVPGMDKDELNIDVSDHGIAISGIRKSEAQEEDGQGFYRMERSFGTFSRHIPLPQDATAEGVEANYEKGVLKIKLSKKKEGEIKATSKKIQIQ